MGDDFRFVVGFVAERCHAIDVAESPDAVSRRFQELIGFNVAPLIEADVGIFQVEEICRRLDAGGHQDFFGSDFGFFTAVDVADLENFEAVAQADAQRVLF